MIGGGIIVAAAFLIMMPGIVSYLFSLSRIFTIIAVTVGVAGVSGLIYVRLKATRQISRAKGKSDEPKAAPESTMES